MTESNYSRAGDECRTGLASISTAEPLPVASEPALAPLKARSPEKLPSYFFAPNLTIGVGKRPFETITALAAKLGITMNTNPGGVVPGKYAPNDFALMVANQHLSFAYRVICRLRFLW